MIWRWLRGRRFAGIKFRRQQPIGRYVLDFYCDDLKLAVELDGLGHGGAQDRRRTAWLNRHGIAVIRFRNQQVLDDPDTVALSLRAKIEFNARLQREPLTRRSAPPSPAVYSI